MAIPNNPWMEAATTLRRRHARNRDEMFHALDFLINHAFGFDNRIRLNDLVDHLNNQGFDFEREEFQQQVLNQLKQAGAVATLVYPGGRGGVFIPISQQELEHAVSQVFDRVESELENIAGSSQGADFQQIIIDILNHIRNHRPV